MSLPIAEAVETSGVSWCEVARAMGWSNGRGYHGRWDVSRVKRTVGLSPYSKQKQLTLFCWVDYELAVDIVRAIDRDPVDFGL